MRRWIGDREQRYPIILAAIVFLALFVDAPTLRITFIGDDAWRANIDGWMAVHHSGLLAAFRGELQQEDFLSGRFHPLFIALTLVEMHLVHQPLPLKLIQLFAIGLNVATLAFVVRETLGSAWRALIGPLFAVSMLQIRNVPDATNGDTLHMQLTVECALLAVGLLAYSLRQRGITRWASYGGSILSFAAALLFYEVTIPLIFPLILSCTRTDRSWAARFALASAFVGILVTDLLAIFVVRHIWPPNAGSFYAPVLGGPYLSAALSQVVSTVPFVYEVVDPQAVFRATNTYWPLSILIGVAGLCAVVGCGLTGKPSQTTLKRNDALGVAVALTTGLALLASGAIVAASPVYQQRIGLAMPYAPVYLQGFGLAIIVATALPARIVSPRARVVLLAACVAAFFALFASNVVVAGQFDASKYERRTIVDGLLHKAGGTVPEGAKVFLDSSYFWVNNNSEYEPNGVKDWVALLWDSRYFYRLWSGRTWQTRPLSFEKLAAGEYAYEIRTAINSARDGTLLFELVRGRSAGRPVLVSAKVFERGEPLSLASVPTIATAFAPADFKIVDGGATWRLMQFRPHCALLPDDALIANAPSAAQITYGDGFSVPETDGAMRWRWAGSRARLELVNLTAASFVSELRGELGTIGTARGTVTLKWPAGRRHIEIDERPRPIRVKVILPPRTRVGIQIEASAPNVAIAGDSRDLRFRLINGVLADDTGCASQDARSSH